MCVLLFLQRNRDDFLVFKCVCARVISFLKLMITHWMINGDDRKLHNLMKNPT